MLQFFTARVAKVVHGKDGNGALLSLDIVGEQDANSKVVSALVQAIPTKGKSKGVLLPFNEGMTAHLILDLVFVRRLQPGDVLRVEWQTRSGGIMNGLSVLARQAPEIRDEAAENGDDDGEVDSDCSNADGGGLDGDPTTDY